MEKAEFTERHLDVIRRFVNSEEFLDIKDAFVSHTPERGMDGRDGDSDSKNLGKLLGSRYVFNELKRLSKGSAPKASNNINSRVRGRAPMVESSQDPDLQD